MEMNVELLDSGIKKINLLGKMDIEGTQEIALKLTFETTVEKAFVIVDLSHVDFMASIGIGALINAAKSLRLRKGKMVLLNPQPYVGDVLEKTQISSILPICQSFEEAKKALLDIPSYQ